MHVSLLRARQKDRGRQLCLAALCLAGACSALLPIQPDANAAGRQDADAIITGSLPPGNAEYLPYELRIEMTRPGQEGLELAGRLAESGGLITQPVRWAIYRTLAGGEHGGKLVYAEDEPVASLSLEPGRYRVEAAYGTVKVVKPIVLPQAQHHGLTFVFNVGGLRTLSTVAGEPLPPSQRAVHRIYATSGLAKGQLMATTDVPGGLVRLGAGRYRVESQIEPGNTISRTDLRIKPGVLTTIQLDHAAGIADVRAAKGQSWELRTTAGERVARGTGPQVLTLAPGQYAWVSGAHIRRISIVAGARPTVVQAN